MSLYLLDAVYFSSHWLRCCGAWIVKQEQSYGIKDDIFQPDILRKFAICSQPANIYEHFKRKTPGQKNWQAANCVEGNFSGNLMYDEKLRGLHDNMSMPNFTVQVAV